MALILINLGILTRRRANLKTPTINNIARLIKRVNMVNGVRVVNGKEWNERKEPGWKWIRPTGLKRRLYIEIINIIANRTLEREAGTYRCCGDVGAPKSTLLVKSIQIKHILLLRSHDDNFQAFICFFLLKFPILCARLKMLLATAFVYNSFPRQRVITRGHSWINASEKRRSGRERL